MRPISSPITSCLPLNSTGRKLLYPFLSPSPSCLPLFPAHRRSTMHPRLPDVIHARPGPNPVLPLHPSQRSSNATPSLQQPQRIVRSPTTLPINPTLPVASQCHWRYIADEPAEFASSVLIATRSPSISSAIPPDGILALPTVSRTPSGTPWLLSESVSTGRHGRVRRHGRRRLQPSATTFPATTTSRGMGSGFPASAGSFRIQVKKSLRGLHGHCRTDSICPIVC